MSLDLEVLDEIGSGNMTAGEARALVRPFLSNLNVEAVQQLYTVLRTWVWNVVNERRRDDELRDWSAFIKSLSSFVYDDYRQHAERLMVLHELVHQSLAVAGKFNAETVFERSHTKDILLALRNSPRGELKRSEIRDRFGFKDPNLSRVLTMLLSSGLVERQVQGRFAIFRLSKEGELRTQEMPGRETAGARPYSAVGIAFEDWSERFHYHRKPETQPAHAVHGFFATPPEPRLASPRGEEDSPGRQSPRIKDARRQKYKPRSLRKITEATDGKSQNFPLFAQQGAGRPYYQGVR